MKELALSKVSRTLCVLLALFSLCLSCRFTRAQKGFVSIDCGGSKNYRDSNGLEWTSDNTIMYAGNKGSVTPPTSTDVPTQFSTIRYFPGNQSKYCYVFNTRDHGVVTGHAYLVRASFWAGGVLPYETLVHNTVKFKLLLYADEWDDVLIMLPQTSVAVLKEIYVVALKETIDVCLAGKNIGLDIPFISSLVLRPLSSSMTSVQRMIDEAGSRTLSYVHRINYGAPSADTIIRYLEDGTGDTYDRVWQPDTRNPISTTSLVSTGIIDSPPLKVMQTAYQSDDAFNLSFLVLSGNFYHFSIYFSELSPNVTSAGQRVFKIQVANGTGPSFGQAIIDPFQLSSNSRYGMYTAYPLVPLYVGDGGSITFYFSKESGSTYGPIVCCLELLQFSNHDMPLGTDSDDDATLKNVTSYFSSLNTWGGDPCLPYAYNWLLCTNDTRPLISIIVLADNALSGPIPDLRSLQNLEVLDLQGNSLSGSIPDFLGELSSLATLNLASNNFSGQIPSSLLAKVSSKELKFRIGLPT